jgi:glycerate kinase
VHVLAAPDKFRGTASAAEAAEAIAGACVRLGWTCTALPLADGGEGTLEAFGGHNRSSEVAGPDGAAVLAKWRLVNGVAVIEMAEASGLIVAGGMEGNDPLLATSRGTGQLIEQARHLGAHRVIVGVGGSACTDGGAGALEVLDDGRRLDGSDGFEVIVATDVNTRFIDAAAQFGPQKGASPDQVMILRQRLTDLSQEYHRRYGVDVTDLPGSGAAGGLAGGLSCLGAHLESGFDLIATEVGFNEAVAAADLVVTGEGRLDQGSFNGKVVGGVLAAARRAGVRAVVVVGQSTIDPPENCRVVDLSSQYGMSRSILDTTALIAAATEAILREIGAIPA